MYVQESQTWRCKKESPESHWSSGSSTAATLTANVSDDIVHDDDDGDENYGASPKSHKHFIPYMVFCASIWDNVRHHCHHHHYHHHIQKSKSINTVACLIAH